MTAFCFLSVCMSLIIRQIPSYGRMLYLICGFMITVTHFDTVMVDPLRVHWLCSWGWCVNLNRWGWGCSHGGGFFLSETRKCCHAFTGMKEGGLLRRPNFACRHKRVNLLLRLRSSGTAVSQLLWFLCLWRKCWDLFCCIHHKPLLTI